MGSDFTVWETETEFTVDPNEFASLGKATPFENERLFGRCVLTVCNGKAVYTNENNQNNV